MADVGKEGSLGPVQLGQRLSALLRLLVHKPVGDGGNHAGRDEIVKAPDGNYDGREEIVKAPVRLVYWQARADTGNKDGG